MMIKKRIGVILGGFSAERHISVDSGRNIYEKLASSSEYTPVAIFLTGSSDDLKFFTLPINILLKDNADDIHDYLKKNGNNFLRNPSLESLRIGALAITMKYGQELSEPQEVGLIDLPHIIDFAFIALHGHPGEDGTLQQLLENINLPYNGSGAVASHLAMNKYLTNKTLREQGICVAKQILVSQRDWQSEKHVILQMVKDEIGYPTILKPVDDGCSAGVEKINNEESLVSYANRIFSADESFYKKEFLVEELICKGQAKHFLEVTCGLLTHYNDCKELKYEIFSPSESLAEGEVLTLEEKFLAGEGQNITPARFDLDKNKSLKIEKIVQSEIEKVAKILGIEGYARIDAFVRIDQSDRIEVYIIEANSLPAMTPATCIFHQCILHGYKPIDFISKIIEFGWTRWRYQDRRVGQ